MANSYTNKNSDTNNVVSYLNTNIQEVVTSETPAIQGTFNSSDNYNKAYVDSLLNAIGFRSSTQATLGSTFTTTSSSIVKVTGWNTITVNIPVTKNYIVEVDASAYSTSTSTLSFGIYINDVLTTQTGNTIVLDTANSIKHINFKQIFSLTAGSNTFHLGIATTAGTATINSSCKFHLTIF